MAMTRTSSLLDKAIFALPLHFRGPGGAVAVLRDGEVLVRHAWGYADMDRHIAMSARSLMPICSVTKQFVCALMLDLFPDPAMLDGHVADFLPRLVGVRPGTLQLAHNQSGLRDYWALTVLHGARTEGPFTRTDARELIGRTRTTHFLPGTRHSYSNSNFHMLGEIIQSRSGNELGALLAKRILGPAGMETARLAPDTASRPGHTAGYEGNAQTGFFPSVNRIWWAGDAGLVASLDDLIAWERFIDATRHDDGGLYRRLTAPQAFSDGAPAHYGFGLAHADHRGTATTGHGGALRGWRCHRVHAPAERISVIVMFNHEANARAATLSVLDAALGREARPFLPAAAPEALRGNFLDPEGGISATLSPQPGGGLQLRYGTGIELLTPIDANTARNDMTVITVAEHGLRLQRPGDNLDVALAPLAALQGDGLTGADEIAGTYRCNELEAEMHIAIAGGLPHAAFSGFLGTGALQPLYPLAPDTWLMPVRRSMDAPAPGDFTLRFSRDETGRISGVTAGCWLARHNIFRRA